MNIFFDVDQTILGMDNSLRPGTRETMQSLVSVGHRVFLWSGMGIRKEMVRRHKLGPFVSALFQKPPYNHLESLSKMGISVIPDFVVDDDPEVVLAFGGVWVSPYYFGGEDNEMERAYRAAMEYAHKGASADPHFRAKGAKVPLV